MRYFVPALILLMYTGHGHRGSAWIARRHRRIQACLHERQLCLRKVHASVPGIAQRTSVGATLHPLNALGMLLLGVINPAIAWQLPGHSGNSGFNSRQRWPLAHLGATALRRTGANSPRRSTPQASISLGDRVCVISNVKVRGKDVKGWQGVVTESVERDETEWGVCCTVETDATLTVKLQPPGPTGYFAENELQLIVPEGGKKRCSIIEGDRVRVISDVMVKGENRNGCQGIVTNVWEICETDPACCCAELASDHTHTVQLDGTADPVTYYFAEEELRRL